MQILHWKMLIVSAISFSVKRNHNTQTKIDENACTFLDAGDAARITYLFVVSGRQRNVYYGRNVLKFNNNL